MRRFLTGVALICTAMTVHGQLLTYDGKSDLGRTLEGLTAHGMRLKTLATQLKDLQQQYQQTENLLKQTERMGESIKQRFDTSDFGDGNIIDILDESGDYLMGPGRTQQEIQDYIKRYGDINKRTHERVKEVLPQKAYEKYDAVATRVANQRKTALSIQSERMEIYEKLRELAERLDEADNDAEVQKIQGMISAHQTRLQILKQIEDAQEAELRAAFIENQNEVMREQKRIQLRIRHTREEGIERRKGMPIEDTTSEQWMQKFGIKQP